MTLSQLDFEDFTPCLLVASPQMLDPNFFQSVILLIEYQTDGAVGLVINRPLDVTLASVQSPDAAIAEIYQQEQLWYGGPVSTDHLLCLYKTLGRPLADDKVLTDAIALLPSQVLLEGETEASPFPDIFRILVGHAGWSPQQLDSEIQTGSWLVLPIDTDMVFSPTPHTVWTAALQKLGVDPIHYHEAPSNMPN